VLLSHPDITASAVVGIRRPSGTEDVSAAVVVREGATVDTEQLRDYCRTRLTAYKVPKKIVVLDELPRSLVGKVERRKVRDILVSGPQKA
jgi:long-chain acyl-CoA synthetase